MSEGRVKNLHPIMNKFLWMDVETGVRRTTIFLFFLMSIWSIWDSLIGIKFGIEFVGAGIATFNVLSYIIAIYSFMRSKSHLLLLPVMVISVITSLSCMIMGFFVIIKLQTRSSIAFLFTSLGLSAFLIYYWVGLKLVYDKYSQEEGSNKSDDDVSVEV